MPPSIRNILVPTDFSPGSDAALPYAYSLAEPFGARVVLFHAYVVPAYALPDGGVLAAWPETAAKIVEAVEDRLTAAKSNHPPPIGVSLEHASAEGPAADAIMKLAEEDEFDLIVMGTHGRTGIRRALLGSVAEQVVRRAPCPVVTVREHGAQLSHTVTPPLL